MNTLPKVALSSRGTAGAFVAKPVTDAPFPYVILGGREDIPNPSNGREKAAEVVNERAWFAAHVELAQPRWSNARQALVQSLALPQQSLRPPGMGEALQDDAAWDGGTPGGASMRAAPAPLAPPPIKLRAKRRAPTLSQVGDPVAATPEPASAASNPAEPGLPLLKEGSAPLVPIPGLGMASAPVAAWPAARPLVARGPAAAAAAAPQAGGRFKKIIGMALLCGLLGAAGFLLFSEFVSPALNLRSAESGAPQPVASQATVPEATVPAVVAPSQSPAPVIASAPAWADESEAGVGAAAAAKPAEPAQASPAFVSYVAQLRVSGVSLGASPRALINGRMVHLGDLLEPTLGIRLVAVDGAVRHLVFEDNAQARLTARY
jgi:hypothetical protein